jgi:hypothetical protein
VWRVRAPAVAWRVQAYLCQLLLNAVRTQAQAPTSAYVHVSAVCVWVRAWAAWTIAHRLALELICLVLSSAADAADTVAAVAATDDDDAPPAPPAAPGVAAAAAPLADALILVSLPLTFFPPSTWPRSSTGTRSHGLLLYQHGCAAASGGGGSAVTAGALTAAAGHARSDRPADTHLYGP